MRQHLAGQPASTIAALEGLHAGGALITRAWIARSCVEYRMGAWPRSIESGRLALEKAGQLPRSAVRERCEARLALAEALGAQDHPRSREQLVQSDSLLRRLGAAGADLRPRYLRLTGMVALMESDMALASRLFAAAVAAADSLQPAADADAGLALVFLGQAEANLGLPANEAHRAEAARRMESRLGLADERTLLVLGRSVQNSRDPARLPAADARFEAARAALVARGLGESAAAWDLDYFQSRIKIALGRLAESRALLTHAIAVSRRWQGPGNIREMFASIDMGNVCYMNREPAQAVPWFRAAVAIGSTLPASLANDPNVTRVNLAGVLSAQGHLREARDESAAVYESYRARFGEKSRRVAFSAQQAARLSRALGDTALAEQWYQRALVTLPPGGGIEAEEIGNARESYALFSYWAGRYDRGFEAALLPARVRRQFVEETVPWLLDGDALRFAAGQRLINGVLASIALRDPAAPAAMRAEVWTEMALGRGALLESMLGRARAAADTLGEARGTTAPRRALAALVLEALKSGDNPGAQHRRDSLRTAIRARERGDGGARAAAAPEFSLASIAARLGPGVLVSYLRFSYFDKADAAAGLVWNPRDRYLAFVLAGGDVPGTAAGPGLVDLGRADSVDAAVARWRAAPASAGASASRAAGEKLRALVWDPIAPLLAGRRDVHVVPDGELQKVNFYALPAGPEGFLVDQDIVLHRHASERELLAPAAGAAGSGVLAMGGIDYDRAGTELAPLAVATKRLLPSCRGFVDERFASLAATRAEVTAVAALAGAKTSEATHLLAGQAADEAAFKRFAPGKRVVHLATHSFFLGAECAAGTASADVLSQNPLVFSGIALAGANQWQEAVAHGGEDNLLTAEELCGLDLHGVEWLVLSGCESGLGQVQSWEGVYGLPRAARQAGVRSLIMSLAPVDDETSRAWMTALYEAHFTRREATALAVRTASRQVLAWLRAHGRPSEPRLWGAFVALGD